MTLYSPHPRAGATGTTSDVRLLSPIYSPTSSNDVLDDKQEPAVARGNDIHVPMRPQQLQLQLDQAVQPVLLGNGGLRDQHGQSLYEVCKLCKVHSLRN
ncbi:hypothetical protein PC129_g1123 [Phytophthora cactorum]|uniref:Uncharacterized protein n=1 Tax=Phytophthora cactorum TaxID=29920 RepID=A0A8T1IZK8_9STRA|nr:hypothetical protein PC129_g1123 [Phytophthora cactorum]